MKEMITVEKEVYEAVLRNSVKVNDLEAENQQLKELLETASTWIREPRLKREIVMLQTLKRRINNAIGEKK